MRTIAIVLVLVAIAIAYWALPADSLPGFFPGFEPGSTQVHVKHGIAAAVAAVLLLGFGWYTGRSRA